MCRKHIKLKSLIIKTLLSTEINKLYSYKNSNKTENSPICKPVHSQHVRGKKKNKKDK